jgi:HK97 family phage major capsid protein
VTTLSATTLTLDEIMKLFHSVKPEYREKDVWVMGDTTALALRILKNNGENYLWSENSTNLLGRPVVISNNMTAIAAGNKPIAFGDFSYYWIVERMPLTIRPLFEKHVLSQLKAYLGYERLDGKLIRPEAIRVLQMAA